MKKLALAGEPSRLSRPHAKRPLCSAHAQQTRVYDVRGNSVGIAGVAIKPITRSNSLDAPQVRARKSP
jgi:hypothetical protein